ncbi:MAG TPA: Cu2+-exporting ATPase, partial [Firmicutes bacterium]|nr:Cu2+-exporting ATPase [Bacillota bacterium]
MVKDEKYFVEGMTCASCVAHVSKAVNKLPGVKDANVSLLTNSMTVSYEEPANPHEICEAVKKAGYGAKLASKEESKKSDDYSSLKEELKDKETPKLLRRLILSLILLIPLFYFGMGYMNMDWHWPLGVIGENPLMFGLLEGSLALLIMLLNRNFYTSGVKALLHGGANMDTLVALGSGVAFLYGLAMMFVMSSFVTSNGTDYTKVMHYSMCLTFETAGMVPTLITIGKTLESFSKGKTTSALRSLIDLAPKEAHVLRDGKEITILASDVQKGETFLVRPGESFPVDGIVLNGISSANESALTGESMPVDKKEGSPVSSGTINLNGALTCKATNVGDETSLHHIIEMVQNAANSKTKISALADKISGVFVPAILGVSLLVFVCWLIFGKGVVDSLPNDDLLTYAFNRAISVLVIACPCALGLATPVAIMVGSGKGAKNGILFKNALSLEETGKLDFIVLDKTGTITKGNPEVSDVLPFKGIEEESLLQFAYSLENQSEHPLAKAIKRKAQEKVIKLLPISSFEALPGYGIHGKINEEDCYAGNSKLMEEKGLSND